MTDLEKEINVISILGCEDCCDSVKDMARRGKAFNHCCCKKDYNDEKRRSPV